MPKTLIANLGVTGEMVSAQPVPAALTRLEIDGRQPVDVTSMTIVMDANNAQPAMVSIRHVRILDGLEFLSDEIHPISNMSVIIEYQEGL